MRPRLLNTKLTGQALAFHKRHMRRAHDELLSSNSCGDYCIFVRDQKGTILSGRDATTEDISTMELGKAYLLEPRVVATRKRVRAIRKRVRS